MYILYVYMYTYKNWRRNKEIKPFFYTKVFRIVFL